MPAPTKALKAASSCAALLFVATGLVACATSDPSTGSRAVMAERAVAAGFRSENLSSGEFRLAARLRVQAGSESAVIYLEGDGAAWPTRYHPPRDPTPEQTTVLAMALADPRPSVIYLGRPCQYLDAGALAACHPRYWTTHRFAPEVVAAYQSALDELKRRHGIARWHLVGYSGGGVLAALLANRRDDVASLTTVAAPLATARWTAHHRVTPLRGSLDPADDPVPAAAARRPPAIHWIGENDAVVPYAVVEAHALKHGGTVRRVPGFDHHCCWSRDWPRLVKETP